MEGPQAAAFGPDVLYPIDGVLSRVESALVFVTAYASEGFDRQNLTASGSFARRSFAIRIYKLIVQLLHQQVDRQGDELVKYVAAKCDNTVVVINSAGPVDVSWIALIACARPRAEC